MAGKMTASGLVHTLALPGCEEITPFHFFSTENHGKRHEYQGAGELLRAICLPLMYQWIAVREPERARRSTMCASSAFWLTYIAACGLHSYFNVGKLSFLFVAPSHRGHGLGRRRRLLRCAMAEALSMGLKSIELVTLQDIYASAISLYLSEQFKTFQVEKVSHNYHSVFMGRKVVLQ